MTLSSLSSTRSPSLATQEPTLQAPGHPGTAAANALQPPDGLAALRRPAQPGPSAPSQWHVPLPPAAVTVFVPVPVPVPVAVPVQVYYPVRYEVVLTEEQAQALARARELANQYNFGMQLALAGGNYAVLQHHVEGVNRAAGQFRLQWAETGSRECLAAAQGLDIEGALLNGLYEIRRIHKDWLSKTPVVHPEKLMYVLPLFSHALHLCRTRSDAVQFPIAGLREALGRLHQQVVASRESLQAGEWQATDDGQKYAQRHGTVRTDNPDSPPDPFTRLKVACQDLQQILEQLQHALVYGPASLPAADAAAPRQQPSAAPPDTQAPAQSSGPQELAVPHAAGPLSFKSILSKGLPASGSAGMTLRPPTLPARPVATKPDPVAGRAPGPAINPRAPHRTPTQRGPAQPQTARAAREPAAPRTAVPHTAAPVLPPIRTRPTKQATVVRSAASPVMRPTSPTPPASPTSPPALSQADDRVPSSPTGTLATPLPADPAAEAAAQLRQERLAALQTALDPLQAEARRLTDAAQAGAASNTVTGQPWDRPNQEFAAWQEVVKACDACAEKLATEAAALFGPGSWDPEVRRLQQGIDKASRQALERAGEAASETLAAFAQTCHKAIVVGDLLGAGFNSYAQLAGHCRALHEQWGGNTIVRPRLPELEGRMGQYMAYENACRARDDDPATKVPVLDKAELLYEAATLSRRAFAGAQSALDDRLRAFHKACTSGRSDLLEAAVTREVEAVHDIHVEQGEILAPVLERVSAIAAACDTLLIGDPLQQAWKPGSEHEPWSIQRQHDHLLIDEAHEAAEVAHAQYDQFIELPAHDVPQRAVYEQQAGRAVLRHVELTATTAAHAAECFHGLAETLGTTPPHERPALVREHVEILEEHASDLQESLRDQREIAGKVRNPSLRELLDVSQTRLRADLRTTQRMHMALEAHQHLLEERVSAQQVRSRIEQCSLADLARPAYDTIAEVLSAGMNSVQQALRDEKKKIRGDVWKAESDLHSQIASAMQDLIAGEKVLTQGQLLLAWAGQPGSGHLDRPEDLRALEAQVATLTQALATQINPALKRRAAPPKPDHKNQAQLVAMLATQVNPVLEQRTGPPEHAEKYQAQLVTNQQMQRDLLRLLMDLRKRSAAADAAAGGSRQAEVPTTQPAAPEVRESRSSRRSRTGRR